MAMLTTATSEVGARETWQPAGGEPHDDATLLGLFVSGEERQAEAAFQTLVRRHGPMVLGVCRHILDRHHDAEDAFQATFLTLARNAAAIRDRRVLARWLYEVAYRTSLRARGRLARRRTQEMEAAEMARQGHASECDPAWGELRPVLHEEINRLPERYRSVVVLCYLEGLTNEDAAAALDWPVGTVKGRLSRARDLLRSRLVRRGLVLSAMFLLSRLSRNMAFAEVVPSALVESTARTAVAAARGGAAAAEIPARVSELADPGRHAGSLPRAARAALAAALAGAATLAAAMSVRAATDFDEFSYRPAALLRALTSPSRLFGVDRPAGCHQRDSR